MKFKLLSIIALLFLVVSIGPLSLQVFAQQDVASLQPDKGGADNFVYTPKGRRDPFKPLIQKNPQMVKKSNGRAEKLKGPLEKFELSQFRLVALMVVKGVPRAMVKAPDGKSYSVKIGDYIGINGGQVKKIETKVIDVDANGMRLEKSPDRIVVEEVGVDSYTGNEVRENRYIVM